MRKNALLKTEPCPEQEEKNKYPVVASQILFMNGYDILNVDIFYKGELRGRYFADKAKQEYAAYVDGKWHECMLGNAARLCMGLPPNGSFYVYYDTSYDWATKEDKERALEYLNTYNFESFESAVNHKKRMTAIERKRKKICDLMDIVPTVPEDAEKWIKDEVFPEDFLFFKKEKSRTQYGCTACGAISWKKTAWKHGKIVSCPKCGKSIKTNSRTTERTRTEPVIILQICGEDWVERQFKAVCTWSTGKKEVILHEQLRAIIPKGKCWGKVYYGTEREADEFMQEFWDKNPENKRFVPSYLYPGNLKEVLSYGNLEKSGMDFIAAKKQKFNVNKYITSFHERPWTEYFAKMGMSKIIADIVDGYGWWGNPSSTNKNGSSAREVLRLDGNRVSRLKEINGGLTCLEWLQYEQEHNIRISQESLEYLHKKDVTLDNCRSILNELKSVNRMVNYMKKQKVSPRKLVITWRDYLHMAKEEGMDVTDDIVRLPRDLKARHDQLVEIRNARWDEEERKRNREKYAELDRQIERHLPETARYFWEDKEYMIIPAGKCEELIEEGRALHHCVGGDRYMRSMAEGKTWICFLRRKNELEKPYYTIEINMNTDKVIQSYSKFDRRPDATAINGILNRWKSSIKRKRQQAEVQIAV